MQGIGMGGAARDDPSRGPAVTKKDEEPDANLRMELDRLAAEQEADDMFLELLDRWQAQGRSVSDKPTANNYAPKMFGTDPDGKGKRKALAGAMARPFAAGKIKVETYGRPSRLSSRLVRCG